MWITSAFIQVLYLLNGNYLFWKQKPTHRAVPSSFLRQQGYIPNIGYQTWGQSGPRLLKCVIAVFSCVLLAKEREAAGVRLCRLGWFYSWQPVSLAGVGGIGVPVTGRASPVPPGPSGSCQAGLWAELSFPASPPGLPWQILWKA